MKIKIQIVLILIAGLSFLGKTQSVTENRLALLTDRDFCVSGDTVWFKVLFSEQESLQGNIVRVQLVAGGNNLITEVAKKSSGKIAEGFLAVPDSLSTGVCFISAFLNSQREKPVLNVESQALFVYNRFEEYISEIEMPDTTFKIDCEIFSEQIKISTGKNHYSPREKVQVSFKGTMENIEGAILKATIVDPLSKKWGGKYMYSYESSVEEIPVFAEENGIMISGKVTDSEGNPRGKILVLLSIPGDPPWFDYCITSSTGHFNFFLKNAFGKARIVLQTVAEDEGEYKIQLEKNYLRLKNEPLSHTEILTVEESGFLENFLKGNYFKKIFNPVLTMQETGFEMPPRFEIPFYGNPTVRVIPDEFFDLPDFQEISRELLPGVQYRVRDGNIVFRMLNRQQGAFFDVDPLRLVNGIPVFKNSILASLKSADIKYIHIVQSERLFGDLVFKGILAVSLFDESGSWMTQQTNVSQFTIDCLQKDSRPGYLNAYEANRNHPDIRQVFLWEEFNPGKNQDYSFNLSDLKGEVEISLEGITESGKIFRFLKIITVQ